MAYDYRSLGDFASSYLYKSDSDPSYFKTRNRIQILPNKIIDLIFSCEVKMLYLWSIDTEQKFGKDRFYSEFGSGQ